MSTTLSKEKTIAALLFICYNSKDRERDLYSLLKILYFAEKEHLLKYGRTITGDQIVAMKYGPVLSYAYDILKPVNVNSSYFEVEDNVVQALQEPDMGYLSESDVSCLLSSIKVNENLNFTQLKDKSHDASYNEAWSKSHNSYIPYEQIARHAGANDEFIKYISISNENDILDLNGHW